MERADAPTRIIKKKEAVSKGEKASFLFGEVSEKK
jgi:hypothetical protein